uniref:DUF1003 domain-containing protein n=1 Tax=Chromera velia CCMP2878 TaxID=1169474 RepID=A0A0G4GX38_9ALVE|eukprot:Cvel_5354.t1-p1 / transcript=Cvel_5354.t1 / gene=Cvel_5354 / organism=Chromera_velia_CCMP2878 / gene_product=hypothetical protein / transcript_product=hypothetical protein / location=Cvel_scaffold248:60921-66547(-) / protein_length=962 / sequence_SO=supercontig / SO=protein_coding / is_pseudo=false
MNVPGRSQLSDLWIEGGDTGENVKVVPASHTRSKAKKPEDITTIPFRQSEVGKDAPAGKQHGSREKPAEGGVVGSPDRQRLMESQYGNSKRAHASGMQQPVCVICLHRPRRPCVPLSALQDQTLRDLCHLYPQLQQLVDGLGGEGGRDRGMDVLCVWHVQRLIQRRVDGILSQEKEELSLLNEEAMQMLGDYEFEEANWRGQLDSDSTIGGLFADAVAKGGGSWPFIFFLVGTLGLWCLVNLVLGEERGWDPYPFILLNLFLSTLAAFQAPIIMMSQNRQDAKDRQESAYVYRAVLRGEHQIRHVNAKVDHLLHQQWPRLLKVQTAMMETLQYSQALTQTHNEDHHQGRQRQAQERRRSSSAASSSLSSSSLLGAAAEVSDSPRTSFERDKRGLNQYTHTHIQAHRHRERGSKRPLLLSASARPDPHFSFLLRVLRAQSRSAPVPASGDPPEGSSPSGSASAPTQELKTILFGHWHSEGDNFRGLVERVKLHWPSMLPSAVSGGKIDPPRKGTGGGEMNGRGVHSLGLRVLKQISTLGSAHDQYSVGVSRSSLTKLPSEAKEEGVRGDVAFPSALASSFSFEMPMVTYTLRLSDSTASLDDIFSGEGFVSLRNDFDVVQMNATGRILAVGVEFQRHGFGQSAFFQNGDLPTRYKPAFALRRAERVTDFWKTPLRRVSIAYMPAPTVAVVRLPKGRIVRDLQVTFAPPFECEGAGASRGGFKKGGMDYHQAMGDPLLEGEVPMGGDPMGGVTYRAFMSSAAWKEPPLWTGVVSGEEEAGEDLGWVMVAECQWGGTDEQEVRGGEQTLSEQEEKEGSGSPAAETAAVNRGNTHANTVTLQSAVSGAAASPLASTPPQVWKGLGEERTVPKTVTVGRSPRPRKMPVGSGKFGGEGGQFVDATEEQREGEEGDDPDERERDLCLWKGRLVFSSFVRTHKLPPLLQLLTSVQRLVLVRPWCIPVDFF